jgi:ribosomal protein S18 acetylase RimI-like enzyme
VSVTVRNTEPADFAAVSDLTRRVYPWLAPWTPELLAAHADRFPEGQLVAIDDSSGDVVGMAASLIISWDDYDRDDSYKEFVGTGRFEPHDPGGRTLYGAEVMVDPDHQGQGIGKALYAARRKLVRDLGLLRIRAGGRIPGYADYADQMSAVDFVIEVINGRLDDPTLGFQLSQGFRVFGVIPDYMPDPESRGYATLIEWINGRVAGPEDYAKRNPKFAAPPGMWPGY